MPIPLQTLVAPPGYAIFGGGTDDYLADAAGNRVARAVPPSPNAGQLITLQVFDALTGGSAISTLLDLGGNALGGVFTAAEGDDLGLLIVQAPDSYGQIYADRGYGRRIALTRIDLASRAGQAITDAANAVAQAGTANTAASTAAADASAASASAADAVSAVAQISGSQAAQQHFQQQAALVGAQPLDVLVVGDSIGEGAWASTYNGSWRLQLQTYLQIALTGRVGGLGHVPVIRGFNGTANGMGTPNGDQWTFTGSPTIVRGDPDNPTGNTQAYGLGRRALSMTGTQTATFTFTGTRAQVLYTAVTGGGTMGLQVDGGPVVSQATAGSGGSGRPWLSPVLLFGTHTITVSVVSGTIILDGGCFYNDDYAAGVTVWDGSHSSYRVDSFDGHDANSSAWADSLGTVTPDLVLVALSTNDEHLYNQTGVGEAATGVVYDAGQFRANLDRLVAFVRTKAPLTSIILTVQPWPAGHTGPVTWWNALVTQIKACANANGAGIIDLSVLLPSGTAGSGAGTLYFAPSPTHPNDQGHKKYAELVAAALTIGAQGYGVNDQPWTPIPLVAGYVPATFSGAPATPAAAIINGRLCLRGGVARAAGTALAAGYTQVGTLPFGNPKVPYFASAAVQSVSPSGQVTANTSGVLQINMPAGNTSTWASLNGHGWELS